MKGPFSFNKPYIEEEPGPPCNHRMRGADLFPFSAGKNQKNKLELVVLLTVINPL